MGNEQGKQGGRAPSRVRSKTKSRLRTGVGKQNALSKSSDNATPATDTHSLSDESSRRILKEPMPEKGQVDKEFEAFLSEMAFKPAAADAMRLFPPDKKWELLQQNRSKPTSSEKPASHWAATLDTNPPTQEIFLHLRPVINAHGRKWMQEFVEAQGLRKMFEAGTRAHFEQKNDIILLACLQSFEAFMNNKAGLDFVIADPQAIQDLVMFFDAESVEVKSIVLKLLSVLTWIGDASGLDGPVVRAFDHYKSTVAGNDNRFKTLVRCLKTIKDPLFRTNVAVFINTLVNSCDDLEDRIAVRRDFLQLDIVQLIDELRAEIAQSRATSDAELHNLRAQLDVFETEHARDKHDTTYNNLDISDATKLFEYLLESTRVDGFSHHFVSVLQQLLLVPTDRTLGDLVWNNIQAIVRLAASGSKVAMSPEDFKQKRKESAPRFISYAQLVRLLREREDKFIVEQPLPEATQQDIKKKELKIKQLTQQVTASAAASKKIEELTAELAIAQDDAKQLRKALEALKTGTLMSEQSQELDVLRQENAALKTKIGTLESSGLSGTNGPPAPPAAGVPPPPPAPPAPGAPPPPPAPPAPPAPGAPPAPPAPGAPPAPPAPGAPPAPPPPGAPRAPGAPPAPGAPRPPGAPGMIRPRANVDDPPPGLKAKPKVVPKEKLKNFHWTKLPNAAVPNTVWMKLNDKEIVLDVAALETMFAKVDKTKVASSASPDATPSPKRTSGKPDFIKLIDDKRSYNIDLSLARFKVTPDEIRDAVFAMDEKLLSSSRMQKLKNCCPTPEEIELVRSYDGDRKLLGSTEKFFLALSTVPNIERRLDLWLFKLDFEELFGSPLNKIRTVDHAADDLEKSDTFKHLLRVMLAHGNYLNGGTKKGQAYGFKLSTLRQLDSTKTTDNKMTLLQVIVQYVSAHCPFAGDFVNEFESLREALRIEQDSTLAEVRNLASYMKKIKTQVELESKSKGADSSKDKFVQVMDKFYNEAIQKVDTLVKDSESLVKRCDELAVSYGEPKGKTKWEALFAVFSEFADMYAGAEKKLQKQKMDAEKEALRLEREEKRRINKATRPNGIDTEADSADNTNVIDGVFDALKGAGSKQIMEQLRARRAAGGNRGPAVMPVGDFRSVLKKRS